MNEKNKMFLLCFCFIKEERERGVGYQDRVKENF